MPAFRTHADLRGNMTVYDLLHNEGSMLFQTSKKALSKSALIFLLQDDGFLFSYSVEDSRLVVRRNEAISTIDISSVPENIHLTIVMMWTFTQLTLICRYGDTEADEIKNVASTIPILPPNTLLVWARKSNLIPIDEYESIDEFRAKVHACLQSIQQKIYETGNYLPFWNIVYNGLSIVSRLPKREVEVHSMIHCLLSDQALASSFEIISEYQTGVGNLDFMIMGKIKNRGIGKICIEFKNAHSKDIYKGVTHQLPKYMQNKSVSHGVYCVLNYYGEWFKSPIDQIGWDVKLLTERFKLGDPRQENIKVIVYDLSKPESASK